MENKNCKHENETPADRIIKGYLMPIFGFALMVMAAVGWWQYEVADMTAASIATVGFAIVYMRNSLPTYIKKVINKKLNVK